MAGMRLVSMVNTFVDSIDGDDNVTLAIYKTAAAFQVRPQSVVESVFPYVSETVRNHLLAMKSLVTGAQYIYRLQRSRGRPASRMRRVYRQVA